MTRHLMLAGFLFALSGSALAAPADDKPADTDVVSIEDEDVANKRGRSSSRARSSSRSSKPAARTSSASRSARPAARSASRAPASRSSARPAQRSTTASRSARPAQRSTTASRSARPAQRSAAATRSARPAQRSAAPVARGARPAPRAAARPGARPGPRPTARPGPRPVPPRVAGRPAPTHRVYRLRGTPRGWAPHYHRYHLRTVPHWHYRYWGAGVFIYSPPPPTHNVVIVDRNVRGQRVSRTDERPTRKVDRNGDFGFGLRMGSYSSGYEGGGGYGDFGVGFTARFRPVESVGLEFAYEHHSETFDEQTERINNPMQASVQLYAFPWTRVSPYVSTGLTWNNRSVSDDYFDSNAGEMRVAQANDTLFGPHAGLGIEFAIGQSAALNFEGRAIGYLNQGEEDLSASTAVQGIMGLNFYF